MSTQKLYNLIITFIYDIIIKKGVDYMAVSKDKTGVLVNMDKTLKAELEQLAKADGRSLTNYIVNILKTHIDNINNKDN